ncbi:MAG: RNase adapter RapZ [Gammaproteobacteria bacterium]|nr:MAG: RNase adapter RapZ [Gammaproteobacteria bacterium]
MKLIVTSGRSGSGKSSALHQLEDDGYKCIDNLPVALLPALLDEFAQSAYADFRGIAVGIDARSTDSELKDFNSILYALPSDVDCTVVYLDATDETLIKRFSETRRRHPLSRDNTPLRDAIERERELLDPIARAATVSIDTTGMSIYDLRNAINRQVSLVSSDSLAIMLQSFGFKHGLPSDADLVFDVRMLPNPHWVPELRAHRGNEAVIADIKHYLERWLPVYQDSNRSYVTVAIGCTGGHHRSVYMTERLYRHFEGDYEQLQIRHREL